MNTFLLRTTFTLLSMSFLLSPTLLRAQGSLTASFGTDTSYHCLLEPITLSPSVSGGTAPYTHSWYTGETTDSINILLTLPLQTVYVVVSDAAGANDTASMLVLGLPECVWPGDANGDQVANNLDLLFIGRSFGTNGMVRPDAHINWIGQGAPSWTHSFGGTVNYAHADADGNGIINGSDVVPINTNYGGPQMDNTGSPSSPGSTPLSVDWQGSSYDPGDTITAPILLGSSIIPADSVYGVAFSILYDTTLIQNGSVSIQTEGGWLGDSGNAAIAIYQDFYTAGQVDVGITRITKTPISGSGRVGDITVMIDDITGKKAGLETVNFWIDYVHLIDAAGNLIPVSASASQFSIALAIDDPWLVEAQADLIIQQQSGQVNIRTGQEWNVAQMNIRDITGKHISDISYDGQQWALFTEKISAGMYVVEIEFKNNRRLARKLMID